MSIKRNILLNPGPATTTDSVKYSQVVPDICPREEEFGMVMEFISKELTDIAANNEEYTTVLFGGSGTAAVESMISSASDDGTLLIINNGAYGKRICEIADIYGLNYLEYKSSISEEIDLNELESVIKERNKISRVTNMALIHHETTTGILNDVESIGKICLKYNINLMVDAMSSFAGIPIDMKKMNIKFLASSSNKCIQGMAGVSFVISERNALYESKNIKPRNLYLNLYKQYEYFKNNYQMRFTPPVQILYALKQAIIEAKEETIEKRNERYRKCCEILWTGLDEIGLERLVDDKNSSMLLTTIIEPDSHKYNFEELHKFLFDNGITIYPGKISSKNTFRIANIGEIYPEDMVNVILKLKEYFKNVI